MKKRDAFYRFWIRWKVGLALLLSSFPFRVRFYQEEMKWLFLFCDTWTIKHYLSSKRGKTERVDVKKKKECLSVSQWIADLEEFRKKIILSKNKLKFVLEGKKIKMKKFSSKYDLVVFLLSKFMHFYFQNIQNQISAGDDIFW